MQACHLYKPVVKRLYKPVVKRLYKPVVKRSNDQAIKRAIPGTNYCDSAACYQRC